MKQEQEMKKLSTEEMEKVNAGMKITAVKSKTILPPILEFLKRLFGSEKSENK